MFKFIVSVWNSYALTFKGEAFLLILLMVFILLFFGGVIGVFSVVEMFSCKIFTFISYYLEGSFLMYIISCCF